MRRHLFLSEFHSVAITPPPLYARFVLGTCSRHLDPGSISPRASRGIKATLCHRHLRRCRARRPALVRKSADFAKSTTRSSQALEHLTIESSFWSQTNPIVSRRCLPVTTCASANNMNILNANSWNLVFNLIQMKHFWMMTFHSSSNSSSIIFYETAIFNFWCWW